MPVLERYAVKATTTWGTPADHRHFLPHILELTRRGMLLCDLETTLGKLARNGFPTWPAAERDAVIAYLLDWFHESMRDESLLRFDSVLCGSALLTAVTPFLAAADRADRTLARRYRESCVAASRRGLHLMNPWLGRDTDNSREILRWACREDVPET